MVSEMRFFLRSTSCTHTFTASPILTTSEGWRMKRSAIRYFILSVVQAGASAGLVYLFTSLTHLGGIVDTLVKISVDMCLFIISYQIQRRWVFQVTKTDDSKE